MRTEKKPFPSFDTSYVYILFQQRNIKNKPDWVILNLHISIVVFISLNESSL